MHDEIIEILSDSRNMIYSEKIMPLQFRRTERLLHRGVMLEHDDCIISLPEKGCQIPVITEHIRLISIASRQYVAVCQTAGM